METQVVEQSVKKIPLGDGIFQVEHPTKGTQYEVRVSKRVNGKRVNKQITVKNLTRAKLARRDLIETLGEEIRNGTHEPSVTFAEYLPKFLEEIKKKWSPSTIYRRTSTFRANFLPKFGPMPLKAITSQVVNAHFEEIAKGKRYGSVRELVKCIKALFESARKKGLVAVNPCLDIDMPEKDERDPQGLTEEQVKKLLAVTRQNNLVMFYHIALAVHTGCRAGELRALTWADVDLESQYISVTKTLDPRTGLKDTPKSGKNRTIHFNGELKSILLELKQSYVSEPQNPVLPEWRHFARNEQGTAIRLFCQSIGLPPIRFHDLRATFITLLLKKGVDLVTTMRAAGHTEIKNTQKYLRLSGIEVKDATKDLKFLSDDKNHRSEAEVSQNSKQTED